MSRDDRRNRSFLGSVVAGWSSLDGERTSAYRWLFLVLPIYAAFAFGSSSWPLAAAFAAGIVVYIELLSRAERRWPEWVSVRAVFFRCVEIGLACVALSLIYAKGQNADLFEFYFDGFYAVPVIFAATAAGRRGLGWSVAAASLAVAFGQLVINPQPEVLWSAASLDYWAGVGVYTGIYAVFFATVGGLSLFVREYGTRQQRDLVLKLAGSFSGLRDAVAITDSAGRIMSLNSAAESLFGCKLHHVFSHPIESICPGVNLDEVGDENEEPGTSDLAIRRIDRREVPCEVTVSPYRIEGATAAYVLVVRDLSARIRIESETAQQSRLAEVGRFTSGLVHDFKSPLAGIKGLAEVMLMEERPTHEAEALALIRDEADRVARMVKDMLLFARADDRAPRESIALNEVVERALRLWSYGASVEGVRVHTDLADPSPSVRGCRIQLEQVVLNLLTNGEQAMAAKRGGDLHVRTRLDGDRAVIEVEDHGSGIPDDFIDRIFDPFFTTKSPDQGTGLGLAIVRDLVGSHGGELRVRSRQGAGACFVVELPVDQPAGIGADDPDSLQLSA